MSLLIYLVASLLLGNLIFKMAAIYGGEILPKGNKIDDLTNMNLMNKNKIVAA